jgi:tRNA1(Val) A37 N6-methylase TrmN6
MAIFQNSVVERFLDNLESSVVDSAYARYKEVYSAKRIHEIKKLKEEQYQEGFIKDIFGKVLGYTIPPESPINIELEKKNEKDAKKVDGAIMKDGEVIGVIELKDNKTKNLDKVKDQAFGYKVNHKGCKYVVTSNFQKLRFYIDDATEYEEFDLYNLDRKEFSRFYLFLRKEGLLDKNTPEKLKEETKFHEEDIGKKLYKDYSAFKYKFFDNIVKNNPQYDKLLLFKTSQKFLDRILFVLFAEDKKLIPENAISRIVESWEKADDLHYKPLYELFKILFTHLNIGHTYKSGYEIPAYNGGLFSEDEVLNNLKVDDEVLKDDLLTLSKYDFNTEVDVNILGHIFEHSLSELEQVEAEIKLEVADKTKGKRKKDGVFYTPKYITKYIVDNTIGKLCDEKKLELKIDNYDVSQYQNKNGKLNAKGKTFFKILEDYKEWLFELKIVDPACGSGAFLNQALTYLIDEHKFIDDLIAELTNTPLRLFDTDKAILEKNIFGVDINEESVEIAKLSLWLRTAQKGRKLSNLSNNIKCGNSIINDVEVAGSKAFDWEKEFTEVFANGGFDVVIGNPPYVRKQGLVEHYPEMCDFYEKQYQSATANYDIYALFMERSFDLINNTGIVSYILPHKFLVTDFGAGIRKFFKEHQAVKSILHFGSEMVFADASTYTCIINLDKSSKDRVCFKKIMPLDINKSFEWDFMKYENLNETNWDLQSEKVYDLIEKLKKQPYKVENVFKSIFQGIATSLDAVYVFEGSENGELIKGYNANYDYHFEIEKELVKPILGGKEIQKYQPNNKVNYVLFPYKNGASVSENYIKDYLPKTYSYIKYFEQEIRGRERGRMDIEQGWYLYIYPKNIVKFPYPKIMTREISLGCNMTYDESGEFYHNGKVYSFVKNEDFQVNDKYYLGILNSKVMWFFLKNTGSEYKGGYFVFKTNYLKPFPLPEISNNSDLLIDKTETMLRLNKSLQVLADKVYGLLKSDFSLDNLSKKIKNWHSLEWSEFEKELKKKKIVLSGVQKEEWYERFTRLKEEAQSIKVQIDKTDREIDQMVYELYDLTEDEIKIVEES